MSYSCTASFKKIKSFDELFDFLSKLKKRASNKEVMKKIVDSNIYYCPLNKPSSKNDYYKNLSKTEAYRSNSLEYWLTRIFTFKFTYIKELNNEPFEYLCMLGVPAELYDLFDGSVYFQNSCDQDYEMAEYKGIPEFEKIYKYWMKAPDEDVFLYLRRAEDDSEEYNDALVYFLNSKNHDYERRSAAYKMIAEPVENLLYDDSTTTYVQLFRSYDNILALSDYKKECLSHFIFEKKDEE